MKHFQYRIRERVRFNGRKEYIVCWRDDWFGTGIFWLSRWFPCRDHSALHFVLSFATIEEARAYRDERKAKAEECEQECIAKERTVE